jgi:hypothetical protein
MDASGQETKETRGGAQAGNRRGRDGTWKESDHTHKPGKLSIGDRMGQTTMALDIVHMCETRGEHPAKVLEWGAALEGGPVRTRKKKRAGE